MSRLTGFTNYQLRQPPVRFTSASSGVCSTGIRSGHEPVRGQLTTGRGSGPEDMIPGEKLRLSGDDEVLRELVSGTTSQEVTHLQTPGPRVSSRQSNLF